ncbi:hypothetical protein [Nonomuraea candida]|uniref:hypothetical protein n=1 Tax=Nonomuraea candida TaxID=359159 RepID=UPI00069486C2|nr:hypothetical protein [Nonomuraea candida]
MRNIDDIDGITRALARVEPGRPGGDPSGAGARALLAAITGERPAQPERPEQAAITGERLAQPERSEQATITGERPEQPERSGQPAPSDARRRPRRRPARRPVRRLVLGLAGAGLLAAGIAVGPGLLEEGGTPSYAVTREPGGVVYVQIRDFRDKEGLARRLAELNVPAIVDYAPPGKWCREPRGTLVEDIPRGLYSPPENIPGERPGPGWQMRIDTRLFRPGQTFVWTISERATTTYLMSGPVAPCVLVPDTTHDLKVVESDYRIATRKGGSLAGFRVDEKTVGEVLPEIERRGLKVEYLIMQVAPDNPGGYGELRTQTEPVGDDWIVWEAEEPARGPGRIRLLVTDKRFDRNPVYGGPRDAVIQE